MTDLNVKPAELRTSADMADRVNGEHLHRAIGHALSGTDTVAASLRGWSIGAELTALADSWRPALRGVQERMSATARALRDCAAGHEWDETLIGRDFEGV
jgi:hypothetical protein